MAEHYFVSLSPRETADRIDHAIVDGSITGECIDRYEMTASDGRLCLVQVYEKHYYRAGNRLTLTVTIDDLSGRTRVHAVSGGGGEGLFRFDWGASESFASVVGNALSDVRL